jgi:hypothetical protein
VGLLFPGGTAGRTFGAHRPEYTMRRLIRRIFIVGLVAVLGAYALAAPSGVKQPAAPQSDAWEAIATHLPSVMSVEVQTLT